MIEPTLYKTGDPVQVRFVRPEGDWWRPATIIRDWGWKVSVAYSDHTHHDVERKHVRPANVNGEKSS